MCALRFSHSLDSLTEDGPSLAGRPRRAAPDCFLKPVPLNGSCKQLALNFCDLLLDHAVKVQLTAARERQLFCCVRE